MRRWRSCGTRCTPGWPRQGDRRAAADEIWEKLQGFASFGFPESHSVSFAYIVYASSWLKYHWPTEFFCGLLNAQPMGFYTPNSLVQDAIHHGVVVLPPDINVSEYDCTVEPWKADSADVVEYLAPVASGERSTGRRGPLGGGVAHRASVCPQSRRRRDHSDRGGSSGRRAVPLGRGSGASNRAAARRL